MEKAILMGPFVGEFFWEFFRFAPILPYLQKVKYPKKDIKYIVLTREERFDIYGKKASIFVPLRIEDDYKSRQPECFRLMNYPVEEYQKLTRDFRSKYEKRFDILDHYVPNISKGYFVNKNQFPNKQMVYEYEPRDENYLLMNDYLPKDKPLVVLAARLRKGFKRNWPYWKEFYDLLWENETLKKDFNFIVCGKPGEYIPDERDRFYDMNKITPRNYSSIVGLLMVVIKNAFFTFGSQSAIPNISLLFGVEALEFGNEKQYHTKTYNIKGTPVTFLDSQNFDIEPKLVLAHLENLLYEKIRREYGKKQQRVA
jgi:hypothetical protein